MKAISGPYANKKKDDNTVTRVELLTIDRMINGAELCTDSDTPHVYIYGGPLLKDEELSKKVFNSMRDKWLISQQLQSPFTFVLTPKAIEYHKSIKKS
jgi:hypothetical protein